MLAAYGVVNRSSKTLNALRNIERPRSILHHVRRACPSERAPAAPALSGTVTAGLRSSDRSEETSYTAPVDGIEARKSTPEVSASRGEDSHSLLLNRDLSQAPGSKSEDTPQQASIIGPDIFSRFWPCEDEERKKTRCPNESIYSLWTSGNDPQEPSPTIGFPSEQFVRSEDVRTSSSQDQNSSNDSQGVGDTIPKAAEKPPWADSLFERLRNPKGRNTEPGPKSVKKFSSTDRKSECRLATDQIGPPFYGSIREASPQKIERNLRHIANKHPSVNSVQLMLRELIEVRHVQPQARHYEALILANCEARHGSADALYPILAEMEREKIGIGTSTLRAVLKVLSIHPDARLLNSIIHALLSQWANSTIVDKTRIILTLTRLNQFELALPYLENLIDTLPPPNNLLQTPIPQFLYTSILYRLASPIISDHSAVLHLLYLLSDNNLPISNVCTAYLLDSAAEALHLELTLHLWRSHVDFDYIIPSTGLCRNALLTAERNRNGELARKAARVLEMRGNKDGGVGLELEELEMVREAFLVAEDVNFGFSAVNRLEKRMTELRSEVMKHKSKRRGKGRARDRWR
jgi:hypothetical protein